MKWHRIGVVVFAIVLQSGCMLDNSSLYDGSIRDMPQRWPDELLPCPLVTDIVGSLIIVVTYTQFPFTPNGSNGGGCGYATPGVAFDSESIGYREWRGMDNTGRGINGYAAYYNVYMDANSKVCPSGGNKYGPSGCAIRQQFTDPTWSYHPQSTPYWTSKTWTFNRPLFDRAETINGLTWRHYMFWEYESLNNDANAPALSVGSQLNGMYALSNNLVPPPVVSVPYPEALIFVGEVYEHTVDANHTMLVFANYMRPVTQDAQWFAARRAMLRKLVDAVTIRPLTPELWRTLNLQYQAQVRTQGESRWQRQMHEEAQKAFEAHQQSGSSAGR